MQIGRWAPKKGVLPMIAPTNTAAASLPGEACAASSERPKAWRRARSRASIVELHRLDEAGDHLLLAKADEFHPHLEPHARAREAAHPPLAELRVTHPLSDAERGVARLVVLDIAVVGGMARRTGGRGPLRRADDLFLVALD